MKEQLIYWWQHLPENISPVLLQAGPVQIRYYGIMYLLSFLTVYFLIRFRLNRENPGYSKETINSLFSQVILGVIIGARLGYVVFYNPVYFLQHPLEIFLPITMDNGIRYTGISGMSYHGGLIGVVLAAAIFCRRHKIKFWKLVNFFVPAVPLGYTFGRIGNFLNGELYGRITDKPWGMYFTLDSAYQLRHPSQLYEAFFEGVVLFLILWTLGKSKKFGNFMFSLYLIGYGLIRFIIEFFREPDPQLGFVAGPFTMGQVLCAGMAFIGVIIFFARKKRGGRYGYKRN